jgi:hypothetical protein
MKEGREKHEKEGGGGTENECLNVLSISELQRARYMSVGIQKPADNFNCQGFCC